MVDQVEQSPGVEINKQELPTLPFKYERVYDSEKAQYKQIRHLKARINGVMMEPYTNEEILEQVVGKKERSEWYLSEGWREKGQPTEQIEVEIDGKKVTVFNFNKEKPFTDHHLETAKRVLGQLAQHFPQVLDELRWILIDDIQTSSMFGDPEKYPLNGSTQKPWRAFILQPRGMDLHAHRIQQTNNFEGTLTHELSHLIEARFQDEWLQHFEWKYCLDEPEDWEWRPTPNGLTKRPFNKQTGEMAPNGAFPMQPEQCVSYYAKVDWNEDFCESVVAYVYDPDLLKSISPEKFAILQRHDAKAPKPEVVAHRVSKDKIRLPEINPETVHYYIEEPEQ